MIITLPINKMNTKGFIRLSRTLGQVQDISSNVEPKFMTLEKVTHKLSLNGVVFVLSKIIGIEHEISL